MLLSLATALDACAANDKTYVMKIALATLDDALHQYAKNFAAAVERDSGGRIKTEIYPASQLGSIERQAFRRSSVHRGHTTQPFDRHHRCGVRDELCTPVHNRMRDVCMAAAAMATKTSAFRSWVS